MSEAERWFDGNDRYLAAALAWLRLRLERAAAAPRSLTALVAGPAPSAASLGAAPVQRRRWFRKLPPAVPPPVERRPPQHRAPEPRRDDAAIDTAAKQMREAGEAMTPPPALERIGDQLGLSMFERQVLLLCAATELDSRVAALCASVHGQPWPTFALALSVLDEPAWDVLSPDRPLRFWRLVEVTRTGGSALTAAAIHADERIVNALKGLDHLDERLSHLVRPVQIPDGAPPPSQLAVVTAATRQLQQARPYPGVPLLQLVGADRSSRSNVGSRIAAQLGLPLYGLPLELLPAAPAELDLAARLWHREAALAPVALYIDTDDGGDRGATDRVLQAFLTRTGGLLIIGGRDVHPDLPRPSLLIDVARPTSSEQRTAWEQAVNDRSVDVTPLVAQFDLDTDVIEMIANDAIAGAGEPLGQRLWERCRRHARPRLEALAERIHPNAFWDALVLPDPELALLHQIADQVAQRGRVYEDWGFAERMNRGLGINALFAGESGTGKSMAAEVLANELRLDLYRIDLSSVVSKYIGDTEKNLRQVFDTAEGGGVILFFDEADALFGKRSEVKDAHDRYANIEINYLLQRMEAYRGLAILATNMRSVLDRAFTRRLRFIVTFPFPCATDRARMWERAFPRETPLGDLDIRRLAHLNLTGAGIHNAALNAAFLAATAGRSIAMPDVLEAARNEFRKLERPINEADFRVMQEATA